MEAVAPLPRRCPAELLTLRAAGRWGRRWKHSSSNRARRGADASASGRDRRTGESGVSSGENAANPKSSSSSSSSSSSTNYFQRIDGNKPLPLPPFLRESRSLTFSPYEEKAAPRRSKVEGTYPHGNDMTMQEKLRKVPFATRMQQNPYARMLAESVREDRLSLQRLPRASMLKLNLVEDEQSTSQKGATGEAQDEKGRLTMLPLSLFGEAIPKKKPMAKLSAAEAAAVRQLHDDSESGWRGASTYAMARHDVLAWVSADPGRRADRILGTGMRGSLDNSDYPKRAKHHGGSFVWPADMPEMVLRGHRRVVHRMLRVPMQQKKLADRPGMVTRVPDAGGQVAGLAMLDRLDEVMCVIRMRRSANTAGALAARARQEAEPDEEEPMWKDSEMEMQIWGQRPQPCTDDSAYGSPAAVRYPTLKYRNRRVPLYDLTHLLGGDEAVTKLVAGTSFADSEWVAVSGSLTTMPLLQWLFRLHSYLAYPPQTSAEAARQQS